MDRRIVRKRWRKYLPWGAGAVVLAVAAALYVAFAPGAGAKAVEADDLQISEVRRAPFQDFVPTRGTVEPLQTVYVDAVEGGQVARLVAADGALVQAGEVLAVLTNPQLEREVGAREADVTGRISDVRGQLLQLQRTRAEREREIDQARYELLRARRDLQTRKTLFDKGFLSNVEYKSAGDEARHHEGRVQALQAANASETAMASGQAAEIRRTLGQLQENLISVRRSLDALQIRAPTAGRLTAFELQPGQTIQPGLRVGQIDTEGAYKLASRIDEFFLGRVSTGQPAIARHDGRQYPLRVSRIFPQVSQGGFRVEFTFKGDTPPGVRRGQSMEIEVTLGATRPALILPHGPFLEATGGNWVFVVDPSGRRAERRPIRSGRRNPQQLEVLEGLEPGERVVTSSYEPFAQQNQLILR
jgi:HlyD family secretion protein